MSRKRPAEDGASKGPAAKKARAEARYGKAAVAKYYSPRSAMPVETKYFDTSQSFAIPASADWTGTEVTCSNYIQSDGTTVGAYTDAALLPSAIGAGYGQVQGNKYFMKHMRIRGEVSCAVAQDQADVLQPPAIRLVLVHDTQPNGAQAQGEDVFTDMGSAAQCVYSFLAMGAGGGGRFRILADEVLYGATPVATTDGANTTSEVMPKILFSMSYRPKNPLQVILKANSSTPTVASLSNNNIFLLAKTSGGTWTLTIQSCCRVYYCD